MNDANRPDPTDALQAALSYLQRGWSVIPVGKDKKPLIAWKPYQSTLPTKDQVEGWWKQFPEANVGVVTGKLSGLAVVDVEKGGKVDDLPPAVRVRTGGGGYHLYYRYDPEHPVDNGARVRELTDIRGEGGYVVAPPSIHTSGARYEWETGPDEADLGEFPYWLFQKKLKQGQDSNSGGSCKTDWSDFLQAKVTEGSRNEAAARLAGKLVHDLSPELRESVGWKAMQDWNRNCCEPSLPETELRGVFDSILKTHQDSAKDEEEQGQDMVQRALALFEGARPVLFHDQLDTEYVQMTVEGRRTIFSCESGAFRKYLRKLYWDRYHKALGPEQTDKVIGIVVARACFGSPRIPLHNRVASHEGDFWYDLGEGKAVRCGHEGWLVTQDIPILFQNTAHQEPQAEPREVADPVSILCDLFGLIPIKDDKHRLLLLIWLVTAFVPDIPHPILILHGEKGSSKSTTMRLVLSLIDPSKTDLLALPANDELPQQLAHHYAAFYDNLSRLDQIASDILCRAVTGTGTSKRRLYTNDDDVIYRYRRVIAINGINNVVQAPDLLDRSILIELKRLPNSERRTEREIMDTFLSKKGALLGAIFAVLSQAKAKFAGMTFEPLPRMADFCQWGCAVAEALGAGSVAFVEAYEANIGQQNDEIINDNPVAHAMVKFMEDRVAWEGSPTELHEKLLEVAGAERIDPKLMPKASSTLGKRLKEVNANLLEAGIKVESLRGSDVHRNRSYRITVHSVHPVQTAEASQPASDGSDGMDGRSVTSETVTAEQFLEGQGTTEQLADPKELEKAMQSIFPGSELH